MPYRKVPLAQTVAAQLSYAHSVTAARAGRPTVLRFNAAGRRSLAAPVTEIRMRAAAGTSPTPKPLPYI